MRRASSRERPSRMYSLTEAAALAPSGASPPSSAAAFVSPAAPIAPRRSNLRLLALPVAVVFAVAALNMPFRSHKRASAPPRSAAPAAPVATRLSPAADAPGAGSDAALRLFAAAASGAPGTLLSPFSVSAALSLAGLGATPGSSAAAEFAKTFPQRSAAPLQTAPADVDISSATSLWATKAVLPSYIGAATAAGATVGGPPSVDSINSWVKAATKGYIPSLLSDVPRNVVAILVNAVFFRAPWTTTFPKSETRPAQFTLASGKTKDVKMMRLVQNVFPIGTSSITSDASVSLIEIPYGKNPDADGTTFSAIVALPDEGVSLDTVITQIGKEGSSLWKRWLGELTPRKVDVLGLPRFKLEYGTASVKSPIQSLGLSSAFISDKKNPPFAAMSDDPEVYLDDVYHRATLECTEEGTVASAATAAVMMTRSMPSNRVSFFANRPFIFAVRERSSGEIMFIGRIDDPVDP